jgi:hypothetical protein
VRYHSLSPSQANDISRGLTLRDSNTRVKRFMSYAEGVPAFKQIADETKIPNAITHLKSLDQENTCHIAEAADVCLMLTQGLDESKGVFKELGHVTNASWSEVCLSYAPFLQGN